MIEVNKDECFFDICLTIGESKFRMGYFMGGYDYILYVEPLLETIRMRSKNPGITTKNLFEISKDSEFYEYFDRLYIRIANCKLYEKSADHELFDEISEKLIDSDIHKKIYNKNMNSIVWVCDDGYVKERNYFEIIKTDVGITIIFNEIHYWRPARISTSGSQYGDFYLPFAELFEELVELYELKKGKSQLILK